MPSKPKYYLESSVIIELLEQPKTAPICAAIWTLFEDAQAGRCELITSTLTMLEVLFSVREKDNQAIDPETQKIIDYLWHPGSSPIQLIPCHEAVTRESVEYFRKYLNNEGWSKSKGMDLAHLVTARREKADEFFTTERAMNKWAEIMGFKICEPHAMIPTESDPADLPLLKDATGSKS